MRDYDFVGILLRLLLVVNISVLIACSEAAEEAAKAEPNGKGELEKRPETIISPADTTYFRQMLPISLECTDAQDDCVNTYFSTVVQEPDQSAGNVYNGSFSINPVNNASTVVAYYSVDEEGNIEAVKTKTYIADIEAPVSVNVNLPGGTYSTEVRVKFTCVDNISGCGWIHYSTDGTIYTRIAIEEANLDGIRINKLTTLSYYAEDKVGNVTVVTVDTTEKYEFVTAINDADEVTAEASDGQVTISWVNPPDVNFAGVIIRRDSQGIPIDVNSGVQIFRGDVNINSFVDTGLVNGDTYYYKVFAYDLSIPENTSFGVPLQVTPQDNLAPAVVPVLSATGGDQQVVLAWELPADTDVAGVMIRRGLIGFPATSTDGTLIYEGADLNTVDTSAVNNTEYFYSLFAYDEVPNYSEPGNVTAVTRDTLAPVNVENFYAEARQGKVILHWDLPRGHDIDKVIIRRDTVDFPADPTAGIAIEDSTGPTVALVSPLEDTTVSDATSYFYTAFAYDVSGNVTDGLQSRSSATPMAETLVSLSPADLSVDVNPLIRKVSATFTNALDSTTIPSSLSISALSGSAVAGAVVDTGSTVEFQMDASETQLDLLAQYKATLSSTILDTSGAAVLASDKSWTFTTADGSWGTAQNAVENISDANSYYSLPPYASVDDSGNVLMLWIHNVLDPVSNLYTRRVYSNRFDIQNGIDPNLTVQISAGSTSVEDLKMAGSANGNAVAVWVQSSQIWAAAYIPASGWGLPVRIQDFRSSGFTPEVAMNDKGDVVILWLKQESGAKNIWANTFAFNNGDWSNITEGQRIEFVSDEAINDLKVAVASTGAAIALWGQKGVDGYIKLEHSKYDPLTGWDAMTTAGTHPNNSFGIEERNNSNGTRSLHLLIDDSDNVHAIWQVNNSGLYANQFSFSNKSWTVPVNIGVPFGNGVSSATESFASVNKAGTVVVAWHQPNPNEIADDWLNRYLPETGWGVYLPGPEGTRAKDVNIDDNGNVKIAFNTGLSNSVLRVYRIPASSDWIDVTTRDPNPDKNREQINIVYSSSYSEDRPKVVSDHHGNTLVVWRGYDNSQGGIGSYVGTNRFEFRLIAPDLVVSVDSVNGNATGVTINYTVTNNGTSDAPAFDVSFWADLPALPGAGDAADIVVPVAALAAGTSTTGLSVDIATTLTTGTAYAAVDAADVILETEEANNISNPLPWAYVTAPIVFDFENALVPAAFFPAGGPNWGFDTFTDAQAVVFNYLRSGLISHNERSCTSIYAVGATTISFDYKTSAESTDELSFYINDNLQAGATWGGITALTPVSYTTALGNHRYKWCYIKDGSINSADDAVWIDNISIQ